MENIPSPSRKRLVLLGRLLAGYSESQITSQRIEELTGWSAPQVRRDISLLGVKCGASNGYKVSELKKALSSLLGQNGQTKKCCIVGLGRMGQRLLESTELDDSAFVLVAGFDSNVNRTEVLRSSFPLHPTTKLAQVIKEEGIEFAILTVGVEEAQSIATHLSECGIKGIVNYTPCMLSVPEGVAVENVCLLTALELLSASSS